MKKLTVTALILAFSHFAGHSALADDLVFNSVGTFTDDSVLLQGPLAYAVAAGSAVAVTGVGPKGITFQPDTLNSNPNVTFSGGTFTDSTGYFLPPADTGNAGFNTVLNTGTYSVGSFGLITLNNLVVNRTYQVQVFVDDTQAALAGSKVFFQNSTGANTLPPTTYAYTNGTPAAGAYVTGTFTATATTETLGEGLLIYVYGNFAAPGFMVNGVVVDVANYHLANTPGLTPNQTAVAKNLDGDNPISGPIGPIIAAIGNGPTSQIGTDLDELSPEKLQIYRNIAFDNFVYTATAVDNHLASVRYGQGGFDTSGLTVLNSSESPMMSQIEGHLLAFNAPDSNLINDSADATLGGVRMTDPKDMKEMTTPEAPENSWSGFVDGTVILADLSHNLDDSHADYTTGGVTAGFDYRIAKTFAAGAMFGYGHTYADLDEIGSHARVDTYSPGIYATYADKGFYVNAIAAYDYNNYSETREIPFAALTANGTTHGDQYDGDIDAGYDFHQGALTFGPTLAVQYVHLEINDFNESSAGAADLSIGEQQDDSLRSRLGAALRYQLIGCGHMIFTPHLSVSWQHEYMDNARGITSQFSNQGLGSFTVEGTNTDRDSAFIDLGGDAQINKALSAFVDYETQVGQSDFYAQAVQAGLKVSF